MHCRLEICMMSDNFESKPGSPFDSPQEPPHPSYFHYLYSFVLFIASPEVRCKPWLMRGGQAGQAYTLKVRQDV